MSTAVGPESRTAGGPGVVLTVNAGSSSIKYAIYRAGAAPEQLVRGSVEPCDPSALLTRLEQLKEFADVECVAHRIVHGMQHVAPQIITDELVQELHWLSRFVPDHLPREIELIERFSARRPALPQVACFDTAFHHDMPLVARQVPIPRRFREAGVRRYGFHGLSYEYLMSELTRVAGAEAAAGRVLLAHLGGGASLAAVRHGKSVDTSMGFTPASGLVMRTRLGDTDPALGAYLARAHGVSDDEFERIVNHESGMLAVAETSADMRRLLERESTDRRAAEAIALFCYQCIKWAGGFAAVLGGIDTLVFAGGIGENAPAIRARICAALRFLGVELDAAANERNAGVISAGNGRVCVRVIRTDEELMIARSAFRVTAGAA